MGLHVWLGELRCCYLFSTTWGMNSPKIRFMVRASDCLTPLALRCVTSSISLWYCQVIASTFNYVSSTLPLV